MPADNKLELVVTVELDTADQSIKTAKANLSTDVTLYAFDGTRRSMWPQSKEIHFECSDPKLTGEYRLTAGPIAR